MHRIRHQRVSPCNALQTIAFTDQVPCTDEMSAGDEFPQTAKKGRRGTSATTSRADKKAKQVLSWNFGKGKTVLGTAKELAPDVFRKVFEDIFQEFCGSLQVPLNDEAAFRVAGRVEAIFPERLLEALCRIQEGGPISKEQLKPTALKQANDYAKKLVKLPPPAHAADSTPDVVRSAVSAGNAAMLKGARERRDSSMITKDVYEKYRAFSVFLKQFYIAYFDPAKQGKPPVLDRAAAGSRLNPPMRIPTAEDVFISDEDFYEIVTGGGSRASWFPRLWMKEVRDGTRQVQPRDGLFPCVDASGEITDTRRSIFRQLFNKQGVLVVDMNTYLSYNGKEFGTYCNVATGAMNKLPVQCMGKTKHPKNAVLKVLIWK